MIGPAALRAFEADMRRRQQGLMPAGAGEPQQQASAVAVVDDVILKGLSSRDVQLTATTLAAATKDLDPAGVIALTAAIVISVMEGRARIVLDANGAPSVAFT